MTIWLAVTADTYELPIAWAESGKGLAQLLGTTRSGLNQRMLREKAGAREMQYYIRRTMIEVDDESRNENAKEPRNVRRHRKESANRDGAG